MPVAKLNKENNKISRSLLIWVVMQGSDDVSSTKPEGLNFSISTIFFILFVDEWIKFVF